MSGVKTKLALMQVSEEIVKLADAIEVAPIEDTECSVEQASCYVDESKQAEKTPLKRSKKQKPLKSIKRRRKQSVPPNAKLGHHMTSDGPICDIEGGRASLWSNQEE